MNDLWQRTMRELRNPRKAGLVLILLVVALLLWGRFVWQHVPSRASADATAVATPSEAESTLTEPVLPAEPDRREVELSVAESLSRDLFALPRGAYAPGADESSRQKGEKSSEKPADENGRLTSARRAAAGLSLQSVATGEHPYAVINGQVLAPGQRINGLKVIRIGERHVLLGWEDVTIRLEMDM